MFSARRTPTGPDYRGLANHRAGRTTTLVARAHSGTADTAPSAGHPRLIGEPDQRKTDCAHPGLPVFPARVQPRTHWITRR